jgi:acetyl esterase/lipase
VVRERAVLTLAGLILFFLLTAGCDTARPVQLLVGDQQLAALYWEPPRRLSPAVLLLAAGRKEEWVPLATVLRKEGYGVLVLEWGRQGDTEREQVLADVRAGFAFLRAQKKVDAARIGLIGAGLAANAAILFAASEPLARLVVLLAPRPSTSGAVVELSMRDYGARPLLLLAAEDDAAAVDVARRLAAAAQGEAVVAHPSVPAAPLPAEEILAFLRAHL